MMLFTLDKRVRVTDSRTYILDRDTVLALNLLEAHPSNQASKDNGDRHSCAADYGLPVADLGIDYDTVVCVHVDLIIPPRGYRPT